ncbi:sodium/glutamate symporter [Bacillus mesophilum]|uniref:Sodium/glutamate symporter n=1 Tax=Bacillus mesophilum TaxID=1071718 RepID=A0A7V7RIU1_9BACI|nr:sodium/glutamate symporter [Bacillus mesophilum]KAB2330344.1 sodium/glutamate symporter [Bacillus mesophilum]
MQIELSQVHTLFLAVAVLMFGLYLIKKITFLNKFCIPAPVVGGFLFAILVFILRGLNIIEISLDTSLQSLFMLLFFTSVGLGASFSLLWQGGKILVIYWLICGGIAFFQNTIAVLLAKVFDLHPLQGLMAGAPSLEGGHGGAAAFGETIEAMGIDSAITIGLAAATLGLIAGGITGGPVAKYLINKHNLKPDPSILNQQSASAADDPAKPITTNLIMQQIFLLTFCISLGVILSGYFSDLTDFVLPDYVGAMFVAVLVRNIIDRFKKPVYDQRSVSLIGDVALGIFLSMALMSIQLWEIANLALPILVIVVIQVIFMVLLAIFVGFRLLGKDFDAAVMMGGMTGHGLGATPNAMANMDAITKQFGPSPKAFLVIPIVGAFLVDALYIPIVVGFINYFS